MIVLLSASSDVERLQPVLNDPERVAGIVTALTGVEPVSVNDAPHTTAADDYLVDMGAGYTFPEAAVTGGIASMAEHGVGCLVANLNWQVYGSPTAQVPPLILREVPDYDNRVVNVVDQHGTVHDTRPFTVEENAQADHVASLEARDTLYAQNRDRIAASLVTFKQANDAYMGLTAPTPEDMDAYLKTIAKELNILGFWLSGALGDLSDELGEPAPPAA